MHSQINILFDKQYEEIFFPHKLTFIYMIYEYSKNKPEKN